ncbi:hypothetical protein BLAT2472_150024 [Burkholderia latens]
MGWCSSARRCTARTTRPHRNARPLRRWVSSRVRPDRAAHAATERRRGAETRTGRAPSPSADAPAWIYDALTVTPARLAARRADWAHDMRESGHRLFSDAPRQRLVFRIGASGAQAAWDGACPRKPS